jgi:hypothetical protein
MRAPGVALLTLAVVASCAPTEFPSTAPSEGAPAVAPPSPSPTVTASFPPRSAFRLVDITACRVTKPVQAPSRIGDALYGSSQAFGNEGLWVGGLGENGLALVDRLFLEPDGSIGWKLGWYRRTSGLLSISGRRIDAESPPLRSDVSSGYGSIGFQASGVEFPSEGCWELTGRTDSARLDFVMFVLRTE